MVTGWCGLTDTGLVRDHNEDAYYIDPAGRYFIVADGMGGHAGGEMASQLAVVETRHTLDYLWDAEPDPAERLHQAICRANGRILETQRRYPTMADMGTTLVVLLLDTQPRVWFAHVGDSRLYRWQAQHLQQLTTDHTWVAQAVSRGLLEADQVRWHPWRHLLTQCLGRPDLEAIKVQAVDAAPGDWFLLCSDGLTEELTDEDIAHLLTTALTPEEASQNLVDAARSQGGRDNITVLVVAPTWTTPEDCSL